MCASSPFWISTAALTASKGSANVAITASPMVLITVPLCRVIWGITMSSDENVTKFVNRIRPGFPVILDKSGVSKSYQATKILPTVCIIGPNNKIMDYFQGGGKTTEIMLVRLAERQLQRKQTMLAHAIGSAVEKKNPNNMKAKAIKGYAALSQGDINGAEKTFNQMAKKGGKEEVIGQEGLVAVYAKKGETQKAFDMANEVEQKAPDRPFVHVVKGDLLYSQNRKEEAENQYKKAINKKEAEPYQKAVAYNQLGRVQATLGNYEKARNLYDQAIEIDPYYIEATSNKGVTYEKEGQWDKALDAYRYTMILNKKDTFAAVLAKKAEEMLALQENTAKKKRIDKLVKELAKRYRSQKKSLLKKEDSWTSRPMIISFVDFKEKGGLAQRDGLSIVLTTQLADWLNASGRVRVVERVLMERLLEELNIGSSELADPETALKLGKVLAAKIISTGSLFYMQGGTMLNLRLIDTETSAIPKVITREINLQTSLEKELSRLNREIIKTIIQKYPLRGYVVNSSKEQVMVNLGSNQGVVLGTKFEIIEEQEPIKYKGRTLQGLPKTIAQVEIMKVEPDLSYARIIKQDRPLVADDKIREEMGIPY